MHVYRKWNPPIINTAFFDCTLFTWCVFAFFINKAGEKAKDERSKGDWFSISTTSVKTVNVQLTEMEQELGADFSSMDSYLLYLYGVVCKNLKLDIKAQSALIQSVLMNPWNWSAWLELQSFVTSVSKVHFQIHHEYR
jgi:ABC-type dipeptide/oligopeptide/nickel transport system permease component